MNHGNPAFAGTRLDTIGEATLASDHAHTLRLARYRFPDGTVVPYLEIEEHGPGDYHGARLVPVSEAVHALLNLGDMEIYQVGSRERDWRGQRTGGG